VWFLAVLACMALLGWFRGLLGNGPQLVVFAIMSVVATSVLWWFTAWYMLMGQLRWRVLLVSGAITAIALAVYGLAASIWMPNVVTKNEAQFGFFGVALALVTWFSGAAIAIIVGACAGSVFAEDRGRVGTLIRGRDRSLLVEGAEPSFAAPERGPRLRDAFRSTEDEVGTS
jgi:membrane protein